MYAGIRIHTCMHQDAYHVRIPQVFLTLHHNVLALPFSAAVVMSMIVDLTIRYTYQSILPAKLHSAKIVCDDKVRKICIHLCMYV